MTALALTDNLTLAHPSPPTDDTLVAMWLHGRPMNTKRAYEADVAKLRTFIPLPLATISLDQLQRFSDSLAGADASTARTIGSIKSLFTFGHKLGYLPFDTARALQSPKRRTGVRAERILSEDQVHAMIDGEFDPRNQLILRLLYVSGVRVSELCSLRRLDCVARDNGGQITVTGKGDKTRSILIPSSVWTDLHLRRGVSTDRVFKLGQSQIWRIVRAAAERANITVGVSPHWMRHCCCSHALANGADLGVVQSTAGHANIATTSGYLHARPNESAGMWLKV